MRIYMVRYMITELQNEVDGLWSMRSKLSRMTEGKNFTEKTVRMVQHSVFEIDCLRIESQNLLNQLKRTEHQLHSSLAMM
jgi:CRISPR/Cas system-associated endoribonuclease Cas2